MLLFSRYLYTFRICLNEMKNCINDENVSTWDDDENMFQPEMIMKICFNVKWKWLKLLTSTDKWQSKVVSVSVFSCNNGKDLITYLHLSAKLIQWQSLKTANKYLTSAKRHECSFRVMLFSSYIAYNITQCMNTCNLNVKDYYNLNYDKSSTHSDFSHPQMMTLLA